MCNVCNKVYSSGFTCQLSTHCHVYVNDYDQLFCQWPTKDDTTGQAYLFNDSWFLFSASFVTASTLLELFEQFDLCHLFLNSCHKEEKGVEKRWWGYQDSTYSTAIQAH